MAGCHEQAVALRPAETHVGAALWQFDVADRLAFRIENPHAVELARAHAPAGPEIAGDIDAEAVRRLFLLADDQLAALVDLVAMDVEGVDRAMAGLALDDVEKLFVGRECEP